MTLGEEQRYQQLQQSDNEGTTVRTQAAFVNKLYKMLEDTSIQSLISWSDRGDLFSVSNPTIFSKSVLPQYFKHNNWQSFVRQLNMYGFHKVNDMIHSNLTSDNQTWEFKHPHFKKGNIEDLQNIKRKSTKPNFSNLPARISGNSRSQSENDEDIYGPMYKHILHIEDRLHHVSRSYEILKNETNTLRSLLGKQQKTIGDFALLLSDVLEGDAVSKEAKESKRDSIMTRLSELQSLFYATQPQQAAGFQDAYYPQQQQQQQPQETSPSPINGEPYLNEQSLAQGPKSFEQYVHSQQYRLHSRESYSSQSTASSPSNVSTNRRLGFGKESHLLNPEPSSNYAVDAKTLDHDNENPIKKQRTE